MTTQTTWTQAEGGLLGLLVGDAVGVPYEFRRPEELPPFEEIDMLPPKGFVRTYSHVLPGTWSDDGAQALCLLDSLLSCNGWNPSDFATRLLEWFRHGYLAVDNKVFDVGIQTGAALDRLAEGIPPLEAGLSGERNNGNGSLMRTLPIALVHTGDDASLVTLAHEQSLVTHGHPRSQVCCALYALWARREMANSPTPWDDATSALRDIYQTDPVREAELTHILETAPSIEKPTGTGYVVDCIHSARLACREATYPDIIRRAVSLGNDTDTTACVAGGIAGIRHGIQGIPSPWLAALRGQSALTPLLDRLQKHRTVGVSPASKTKCG